MCCAVCVVNCCFASRWWCLSRSSKWQRYAGSYSVAESGISLQRTFHCGEVINDKHRSRSDLLIVVHFKYEVLIVSANIWTLFSVFYCIFLQEFQRTQNTAPGKYLYHVIVSLHTLTLTLIFNPILVYWSQHDKIKIYIFKTLIFKRGLNSVRLHTDLWLAFIIPV